MKTRSFLLTGRRLPAFGVACCIVALVVMGVGLAIAADSPPPITRPVVSEKACPVEVITVTSRDGNNITAVVRRPPGRGYFPALIHLHGGLGSESLARLKDLSLNNVTMCRFLAAGYITVNPTFRSRENNPQTRDALVDCLAIVEHVKKMAAVDPKSVVLWGDSGGGSLVLELAGETDLCAVTAQEPATVLFSGVFNNATLGAPGSPDYKKNWNRIMQTPKDYYTPELEKFTREKIARIHCPVFIAHGDKHPINIINNEIVLPALRTAGKQVEVILYPGENHGFSHNGTPEMTKKFFDDCHAFYMRHLPVKPVALPETIVQHIAANRKKEPVE
jgi:acetyl esterase/lipase